MSGSGLCSRVSGGMFETSDQAPPSIAGTNDYLLIMFGAIAAFYVLGARTEQVHNEVNSVTSTTAEVIRTHFKHARADLVLRSNSRQLIRYPQSGDDRYVLQQPALIDKSPSIRRPVLSILEISLILDDGFEDIRLVNIDLANRSVDESNSLFFSQVKPHGKG